MYVLKTIKAQYDPQFPTLNYATQHLYEMTAKELASANACENGRVTYRKVSAQYAHKFVKDDGIHSTALYVDMDGRIRKASGDNC